jgi:hypothetical protein
MGRKALQSGPKSTTLVLLGQPSPSTAKTEVRSRVGPGDVARWRAWQTGGAAPAPPLLAIPSFFSFPFRELLNHAHNTSDAGR